jgi:MoaA/NifB/PqqE/SkfB family radical SAM enzyme
MAPPASPLFPKEIVLEVTNACNLRCRYCHFHAPGVARKRRLGFMDRKVWGKVLDELRTWTAPVTLLTHGAGEPLLYRDLSDLLRAAKEIPQVNLGFMTNGMLLDGEWAWRLVDLQVNWLALSIDGVVPETHDHFRGRADLRLIEKNVVRLIEEKMSRGSRLPVLLFNMVGYPEILDQSRAYVERWLPHAERVTVATFRPLGSRRLWHGEPSIPGRPCPLLWSQMVIGFDGSVGLCCEDINLDVPLGSVLESSLEELYNRTPRLLDYRRRHALGDTGRLTLCSDCHVWGGDVVLHRQRFRLGDMVVEQVESPAFQEFRRVE